MNSLLLVVAILMPILMIFLMFTLIDTKKSLENNMPAEMKQPGNVKKIKKELQKIKTEFDYCSFYEYNKVLLLVIIILLLVVATGFIVFCDYNEYINTHSYYSQRMFIRSILGSIAVLILVFIRLVYDVKKIQVNDSNLIIKKGFKTKEYSIPDIEELKIKIKVAINSKYNTRIPNLCIKNKNSTEYEKYRLNLYSAKKIIALVVFITLIKQNRVNTIDTIAEEEIQNLVDEIFIKGAI